MAKQSTSWLTFHKRWPLLLVALLSTSTVIVLLIRAASDSCNTNSVTTTTTPHYSYENTRIQVTSQVETPSNPLRFMKSKLVLLVSHELSLSGGPLLLMELAFLLRGVGAEVVWLTIQKPTDSDEVIYSLEHRMLDRGVKVFPAKGQEAIDTALKADLVVLNTAVAGKWLDSVVKENVPRILPKVLWWIHEMRGHYFKLEYVKHLPYVAGAMIDSHTTAEYWKNRTRERLGIKMPETYVVHLGNSKELMEIAENNVAKRVLREHVRESLGVRNEDLLFAIINSVSRGKGQDLFLRSFYQSLQLIKGRKLQVPSIHAVIVGSDMNAQTKFETELRNFVVENKIQDQVHFINKTLTVAPYLASIDVLVQNSQVLPIHLSCQLTYETLFMYACLCNLMKCHPIVEPSEICYYCQRESRTFFDSLYVDRQLFFLVFFIPSFFSYYFMIYWEVAIRPLIHDLVESTLNLDLATMKERLEFIYQIHR